MSDQQQYFNILTNGVYEGATVAYRREQSGILYGKQDNLAARELLLLQARSAHAIRNNGYASAAAKKFAENMKCLTINWVDKKGRKHKRMQDKWDAFIESPMLDGYGDFKTYQSLHHRSSFLSGSSITRYQIRHNKDNVPLKLELIEPEFQDVFYKGTNAFEDVKHGIKFIDTKPFEYYFLQARFDSTPLPVENPFARIVIPADEIQHSFIREFPNQWLGIPSLAPVLIQLYELDDLADATTAKQKAAQAITWIVENSNMLNMTPVGAPTLAKDKDNNDKIIFKTSGGNVQYLNKGEKLTSVQSSDIGNNLVPFMELELRRISSALGLPYYQLTGDYKGIDFSTLRGIAIELRNRIEYIHQFFTIPTNISPLARKFQEIALLYDPRVADAKPTFQMPRYYGVDELKDIQADLLEVQSGVATLQSKLDERHTTFEEITADRERIAELGLDHILFPNGQPMAQANNTQANNNSTGNA